MAIKDKDIIFKNNEIEEKVKGKKKDALEDKKLIKELTDALMERIIELNPELTDKELKQLIADKYTVMKTKKIISLKPVEDRFKGRIEKYINHVREVRLK